MKQDNLTARLLGYLRHLMNDDPVVREAHLMGPDHLQVSFQTKAGEMVAFMRTDSAGALPPLRVPVSLLEEDSQSGYEAVKQCVYGWLEANKEAIGHPSRGKDKKRRYLRMSRPIGN